ncbi:hypothetical protein EMCRGX_G015040 [Ephydatia muelleri]
MLFHRHACLVRCQEKLLVKGVTRALSASSRLCIVKSSVRDPITRHKWSKLTSTISYYTSSSLKENEL